METSPFKDSNLLMISFLTCVVELAFTSWLCIRQNLLGCHAHQNHANNRINGNLKKDGRFAGANPVASVIQKGLLAVSYNIEEL